MLKGVVCIKKLRIFSDAHIHHQHALLTKLGFLSVVTNHCNSLLYVYIWIYFIAKHLFFPLHYFIILAGCFAHSVVLLFNCQPFCDFRHAVFPFIPPNTSDMFLLNDTCSILLYYSIISSSEKRKRATVFPWHFGRNRPRASIQWYCTQVAIMFIVLWHYTNIPILCMHIG